MRPLFAGLLLGGNDIFISYSSKDREQAERIERVLIGGGYRVYRDETALKTAEHLDRLLDEVRRSTMLVVLVSANSMASDWVESELAAYMERPKSKWRIAPVFLHTRYPKELPDGFSILGEFRGVLPQQLDTSDDARLLRTLTSQFDAIRKTVLRRWTAAGLAILVILVVAWLARMIRTVTATSDLLKRAETASAAFRFDEAEHLLAQAWKLDAKPTTAAAYRAARAHRALERPMRVSLNSKEAVVAADIAGGEPYLVLNSEAEPNLSLVRAGKRSALAAKCEFPLVATQGQVVVWVCGKELATAMANAPEPRVFPLPDKPERIQLWDTTLALLFHDGNVMQVGLFMVPSFHVESLDLLPGATEGGEIGFCPGTSQAWSWRAEEGKAVYRRWTVPSEKPTMQAFVIPEPTGNGIANVSWIARVVPSPDCERFFIDYAPFTAGTRSTFETVRIRPSAVNPVDTFDAKVTDVVPGTDRSGIEAYYRTESKEFRAFVLTSVVVRGTRVRTLGTDVERISGWAGGNPDAVWSLAGSPDSLAVYRNQERWSTYGHAAGETVRIVPSAGGAVVAVQGEKGVVVWRRAEPWTARNPPDPEVLANELGVGVK